ncbi:hypothetical protein PENTCL1PPCAC_804 [Pristionchus entomophagus]|uniref:Uncharacterized protein n=1 Tax=Pristionchus entomophagus TaxID=358040 RepID=A0AAV5SBG9_9BILA|nr:hypothetical protein PENTCL1PPCAC_804 [Pristionchus entomophagus]
MTPRSVSSFLVDYLCNLRAQLFVSLKLKYYLNPLRDRTDSTQSGSFFVSGMIRRAYCEASEKTKKILTTALGGVFEQSNESGSPIYKWISGSKEGMRQVNTKGKTPIYKPVKEDSNRPYYIMGAAAIGAITGVLVKAPVPSHTSFFKFFRYRTPFGGLIGGVLGAAVGALGCRNTGNK